MVNTFSDVKFKVNENYLMAQVLKGNWRIESLFLGGIDSDLDQIPSNIKETVSRQYKEFIELAKSKPSIEEFINYGDLETEEQFKSVDKRITNIGHAQNDEEFLNIESKEMLEDFEDLKKTDFYRYVLDNTENHKTYLEQHFQEEAPKYDEKINTLLGNANDKKRIEMLVLSPELFKNPQSIGNDREETGVQRIHAVFPKASFDNELPNKSTAAMLHEMFHIYMPMPNETKFKNIEKRRQYGDVNHSLIELATNGELGMQICGTSNHLDTRMEMHNEEGIVIARGKTLPYFLLYKNRNSDNSMERTISEIQNSKTSFIERFVQLYINKYLKETPREEQTDLRKQQALEKGKAEGELAFRQISDKMYLTRVNSKVSQIENINELNDLVAEQEFGLKKENGEYEEDYKIETQTIGKATISVSTHLKHQVANQEKTEILRKSRDRNRR